jgi:hypothetical protein
MSEEGLAHNILSLERHKQLLRGMVVTCPHCKSPTFIRSSRLVTEIYREAWCGCALCGFKGMVHLGWDKQVFPSLMPNPNVRLPLMSYDDAVERFAADELFRRDQMDLFVASG